MAEAKTDRRTERTRQAVLSAFVDLMLTRGYANLTVAEVTEAANVGRSTFYAHFGGLEAVLKASLARPSAHLLALIDQTATPDSLIPILSHFQGQKKLNGVMFSSPVRGVWVRALAEMIEPRLAAMARRGAAPRLPLSFIAHQVAEGQIALIAAWLSSRTRIAPEAIAEALIATTRANVAGLLGRPGDGG